MLVVHRLAKRMPFAIFCDVERRMVLVVVLVAMAIVVHRQH
jgi:hypothetical protein